jgi:putative membrane protein
MKNLVVTLFAVAALTACKKNEPTSSSQSTESTTMSPPAESGMTVSDSTKMGEPKDQTTSLSDQDKKFADAAAKGGLMEVMMGDLAATNAENSAVKSLGAMMVRDHTKANDELKKWASGIGYTLPAGLDAEKQKMYDDLKAKKGKDFDKKYTDLMVSDHKEDIEEFKKEAAEGKESSLKSFASKTLPTLEHHLKESEKAKNAVK